MTIYEYMAQRLAYIFRSKSRVYNRGFFKRQKFITCRSWSSLFWISPTSVFSGLYVKDQTSSFLREAGKNSFVDSANNYLSNLDRIVALQRSFEAQLVFFFSNASSCPTAASASFACSSSLPVWARLSIGTIDFLLPGLDGFDSSDKAACLILLRKAIRCHGLSPYLSRMAFTGALGMEHS